MKFASNKWQGRAAPFKYSACDYIDIIKRFPDFSVFTSPSET
jgi:hypothetical protein